MLYLGMAKKKHTPSDPNQLAAHIVERATGTPPPAPTAEEARSAAARMLGSLGGKKGGPARAKALSAKRRREIARDAVRARWAKRDRDNK